MKSLCITYIYEAVSPKLGHRIYSNVHQYIMIDANW